MLKRVHIIGLGLMGTNLGIKLVNGGVQVSGDDILEKNIIRAKELGALSLEHKNSINYDLIILAMPINEIIGYFDNSPGLNSKSPGMETDISNTFEGSKLID